MDYGTTAKRVPRVRDNRHNLEEWNEHGPSNILCLDQEPLESIGQTTYRHHIRIPYYIAYVDDGKLCVEAPLKVIMHRLP